MGQFHIAVLGGDGIGPEVTAEAVRVLQAVAERFGHTFLFKEALVGQSAIEAEGAPVSDETMALCAASDAVLFGAVGTIDTKQSASGPKPESAILRLRKDLELFTNLRPVRPFPALLDASAIRPERLQGVDLVVVRELTGGLYFGKPSEIRERRTARWRWIRWSIARARLSAWCAMRSRWRVAAASESPRWIRPTC